MCHGTSINANAQLLLINVHADVSDEVRSFRYVSHQRAAKDRAVVGICTDSPEP